MADDEQRADDKAASGADQPVKDRDGVGDQYAALRERLLRSKNDTGTVAEALGRRNFLLALLWVALIALAFTFEQVKTRWEYFTVELANQRRADLEEGDRQRITTPSGLQYTDIKVGAGPVPQVGDLILLEYSLALADGTPVISSHDAGQKALGFTLGTGDPSTALPVGLVEGIGTMHQGGKRHLVVPPELGFGDQPVFFPTMTVAASSTLVYDVELVRVSIAPS